jgi:SAM-dependent methyltransferase
MDPREVVVERARVEPGMELLDVACGAGNATIPAAKAGARVTGVDPSADLLAMARESAADAMVEIDWVEGHVHELPFDDGSFDRVVSVFGHMFAPDHRRAAAEMLRVCRAGGVIVTACWTPEGAVGRLLGMLEELVPRDGPPPALWGSEAHAREQLGRGEFERRELEWTGRSAEPFTEFLLEGLGPLLNARELISGREDELRPAFRDFLDAENLNHDGTFRLRGEYLLAAVAR